MKKITYVLFFAVTLFSCSSDNTDSSSSNQINVDGTSYSITDAKAVDNYKLFSETHAEYNFVLASSDIQITGVPGSVFGFQTSNAKFALNLSIAALGATFQNGVYQFDENFGIEEPNFNYFDDLVIYIDGNQDGQINNPQQDKIFFATSGNVTVSGTAPNYTIVFNVTLSNGQNFNFTYNQGFDYVDNRG
jgi:hypothetical protein